jgi:hypothetical protein
VGADMPSLTEFNNHPTSLNAGFAATGATKHAHSFPNEHANGNIIKIPLTMYFSSLGSRPVVEPFDLLNLSWTLWRKSSDRHLRAVEKIQDERNSTSRKQNIGVQRCHARCRGDDRIGPMWRRIGNGRTPAASSFRMPESPEIQRIRPCQPPRLASQEPCRRDRSPWRLRR